MNASAVRSKQWRASGLGGNVCSAQPPPPHTLCLLSLGPYFHPLPPLPQHCLILSETEGGREGKRERDASCGLISRRAHGGCGQAIKPALQPDSALLLSSPCRQPLTHTTRDIWSSPTCPPFIRVHSPWGPAHPRAFFHLTFIYSHVRGNFFFFFT